MRSRKLGRTGWMVSEIGYGAWGIGGNQWRGATDDDGLAALRRALELGLNFIDTALAYNDGHSEQIIARALKESGARAWVATKVPPKNRLWPARPGIGLADVFPYDYIVECTETSLRNLRTETIDLQQLHVWNPEWVDHDDWRRAAEDLKRAGKIRYFGLSINDHQPDSALSAIDTGAIDTVQVIYNIFDQSPERHLFPSALRHDVGVLARVPLDEGALTGAIVPGVAFDPAEFRAFYFRGGRPLQVQHRVEALCRELGDGEPLAESALRFCLSHPAVSTVIPGMRRVTNVNANVCVTLRGVLPVATVQLLRKHAWHKNFYQ